MLEISSSATSNAGKRKQNEDNFYMNEIFIAENNASSGKIYTDNTQRDTQFYAVFDGLGKDIKSEIISKHEPSEGASAAFMGAHMLSMLQRHLKDKTQYNLNSYIGSFIRKTNKNICDYMQKRNVRGGACFALLCISANSAYVYNIGNSKVFLLRDNQLTLLSQNDTKAEALVSARQIGADMIRHAPENKLLTQHLGVFDNEKQLDPHVTRLNIKNGDKFLVCSDGLCDLPSERIHQIMSRDMSEQEIVSDLANEAARGGESMKENLTILVVGVSSSENAAKKANVLRPTTDGPTHFAPLKFRNKFELTPKLVRQILISLGAVAVAIVVLSIIFTNAFKSEEPPDGPTDPSTNDSTEAPIETDPPDTSRPTGNFVITTETTTYDIATIDPNVPMETETAAPTTEPPVTSPPPTEPVVTAPPATDPPETQPPETQSTETEPETENTEETTPGETEEATPGETETEPETEAPTEAPETEPPETEPPETEPETETEAPTAPPETEAPTEPPTDPPTVFEEETIAAE